MKGCISIGGAAGGFIGSCGTRYPAARNCEAAGAAANGNDCDGAADEAASAQSSSLSAYSFAWCALEAQCPSMLQELSCLLHILQ